MRDHEGDFRGFYHLSEAWYGPSNLVNSKYTDEVNFGFFCPDGGTSGEMAMRWQELGGKDVPELTCFSDAWNTLASFPDLIAAMGELDDTDPTPKQFCALLMQLGFKDLTPRENPYGNTDSRKPRRETLLENTLSHLVEALASDDISIVPDDSTVRTHVNNAKQLLGRR
jgi:hypothetical protein